MGDLGLVPILLLMVFILLPLLKAVMQRVGRLEDQIPEEESLTPIRRQAQATRASLPTPRASGHRELQAPIVLTPPAKSHFTRRSLLGTPRDVRRGIILMTILGPCRAFDPPD